MAHINLLPWRQELRRQQREDVLARMLLSVILSALVMLAVHLRFEHIISYQRHRNEFLQSEIRLLDQKIKEIQTLDTKKRRLVARMGVIGELQTSRPEMVHLFDQIARQVPDGIFLTDLTQSDKKLVINGVAQSNARVSTFLQNLESSPWLSKPVLRVVQVRNEKDPKAGGGLSFTVQVSQAVRAAQDVEPSP